MLSEPLSQSFILSRASVSKCIHPEEVETQYSPSTFARRSDLKLTEVEMRLRLGIRMFLEGSGAKVVSPIGCFSTEIKPQRSTELILFLHGM